MKPLDAMTNQGSFAAPEQKETAMNEIALPSIDKTTQTQAALEQPTRINVLGVGVSAIDMQAALELSDALIQSSGRGYVCVTGVHGVMVAQQDPGFREILNGSFLTTPDGMPLVWMGRVKGHGEMRRVFGPDYMMDLCHYGVERGYRHFLFGGNDGVAQQLAAELTNKVPGIQIVGTYTPPFRTLNESEEAELAAQVAASGPDVFWVGLSTPKQERFMAAYLNKLNVKLMVGVGAAFDMHTGRIKDAPAWVKPLGLQWLHRLIQDPRRLASRYGKIVPGFLFLAAAQLLGVRRYSLTR